MAILPEDKLWRVVGGKTTDGILVRIGKDTSSEAASMRLQTGTLIKELELDGERLHYLRIASGMGPTKGWVSVKLKGKDLVLREEILPVGNSGPPAPLAFDEIGDRKIRILALHGTASNSNLLKFMMSGFVKFLGPEFEWVWPNAQLDWQPEPGGSEKVLGFREPGELEVRVSNGLPFKQWYLQTGEGASPTNLMKIEEGCAHLEEVLEKEAPIDVVVAFSAGAVLVSLYIEQLRRAGKAAPWRLNVFFSGGVTNDERYAFRDRALQPTILVTSEGDPAHNAMKLKGADMFSNLTILEHEDGHAVPRKQPRAGEIFELVGGTIRKLCQNK